MFSHPNKELKLHLNNVKKLGMNIFETRKTLWSNDKDIFKTLEIILGTHDFGKGTKYFQEYIVDTENEKFKKSPFMDLKKHGEFSALWCYYLVMKETQNEKLALIAYMVVRKHHGDLTDFKAEEIVLQDDGKDLFYKQLETFGFEYFNLLEEKESFLDFIGNLKAGIKFQMRFKKAINSFTEEDFILCNYLFSILISADKGEAIFYDKGVNFEVLEEIKENRTEIKENLVDEYKKKKFSIKNQVDELREAIYKD